MIPRLPSDTKVTNVFFWIVSNKEYGEHIVCSARVVGKIYRKQPRTLHKSPTFLPSLELRYNYVVGEEELKSLLATYTYDPTSAYKFFYVTANAKAYIRSVFHSVFPKKIKDRLEFNPIEFVRRYTWVLQSHFFESVWLPYNAEKPDSLIVLKKWNRLKPENMRYRRHYKWKTSVQAELNYFGSCYSPLTERSLHVDSFFHFLEHDEKFNFFDSLRDAVIAKNGSYYHKLKRAKQRLKR